MEPLAEAPFRRRGDPGGRWLGDRGAGDSLRRADGERRDRAGRGGGGDGAAGVVRIVCGKGNNGGDGEVAAAASAPAWGSRSEAVSLWSGEVPADLDGWLAGSGAVVDAIFGTGFAGAPRRAGGGRDRGDQPLRGAGRRLRHRLRRRRLQRRGRRGRGRGRPHGQLPRRQAGPPDRARQVAHRRAAGGPDRDPAGAPERTRPAARSSPPCSPWRRAGARARPSSAPAR